MLRGNSDGVNFLTRIKFPGVKFVLSLGLARRAMRDTCPLGLRGVKKVTPSKLLKKALFVLLLFEDASEILSDWCFAKQN
ncbi:MAG: hypothetical protein QG607_187 [Patescibacteria group bacterium]|nr:hypothetical protein [Patescibacteria group bacterium]